MYKVNTKYIIYVSSYLRELIIIIVKGKVIASRRNYSESNHM